MGLLDKIIYPALAVLMALLVASSFYIWHLSGEIDAKNLQIGMLTLANSTLKTSVDNQNKAIQDMRDNDVKQAKAAREAISAARKKAESHLVKAESIKNQVVTGDDCISANKVITAYIMEAGL